MEPPDSIEAGLDIKEEEGTPCHQKSAEGTYCDMCKKRPAAVLCKQCQKFYCSCCKEGHDMISRFSGHSSEELSQLLLCVSHRRNIVDQFCVTCNTSVCVEGLVASHRSHDTMTLGQARDSTRQDLSTVIRDLKKCTSLKSNYGALVQSLKDKIIAKDTLESDLRSSLSLIREAVDHIITTCTKLLETSTQRSTKYMQQLDSMEANLHTAECILTDDKVDLVHARHFLKAVRVAGIPGEEPTLRVPQIPDSLSRLLDMLIAIPAAIKTQIISINEMVLCGDGESKSADNGLGGCTTRGATIKSIHVDNTDTCSVTKSTTEIRFETNITGTTAEDMKGCEISFIASNTENIEGHEMSVIGSTTGGMETCGTNASSSLCSGENIIMTSDLEGIVSGASKRKVGHGGAGDRAGKMPRLYNSAGESAPASKKVILAGNSLLHHSSKSGCQTTPTQSGSVTTTCIEPYDEASNVGSSAISTDNVPVQDEISKPKQTNSASESDCDLFGDIPDTSSTSVALHHHGSSLQTETSSTSVGLHHHGSSLQTGTGRLPEDGDPACIVTPLSDSSTEVSPASNKELPRATSLDLSHSGYEPIIAVLVRKPADVRLPFLSEFVCFMRSTNPNGRLYMTVISLYGCYQQYVARRVGHTEDSPANTWPDEVHLSRQEPGFRDALQLHCTGKYTERPGPTKAYYVCMSLSFNVPHVSTPLRLNDKANLITSSTSPVGGRKRVFASVNLSANQTLCEYRGRRMSREEGVRRGARYVARGLPVAMVYDVTPGICVDGRMHETEDREFRSEENVATLMFNRKPNPNCRLMLDSNQKYYICTTREVAAGCEVSWYQGIESVPQS